MYLMAKKLPDKITYSQQLLLDEYIFLRNKIEASEAKDAKQKLLSIIKDNYAPSFVALTMPIKDYKELKSEHLLSRTMYEKDGHIHIVLAEVLEESKLNAAFDILSSNDYYSKYGQISKVKGDGVLNFWLNQYDYTISESKKRLDQIRSYFTNLTSLEFSDLLNEIDSSDDEIIYYWRKNYSIHSWFLDNTGESEVVEEDLERLLLEVDDKSLQEAALRAKKYLNEGWTLYYEASW